MKRVWHRLFLEERPSISLSLFRVAAALTTGFHVVPTLCHLEDNYFPTAFKTFNTNFFPVGIVQWVQDSPNALIICFAWLFCIACFFFLIGLWSQISCIVMVITCYYFYALNAFHVGTLSWDILLVTLFLMCMTSYHGDYFSVDCLLKRKADAYQRSRPFFIQRLLQMQLGFTFFYTALHKVTVQGNWITDNPIYYLMNKPVASVTKLFLLKDFLYDKPSLCYAIGILIVIIEFLLIFLLFWRKTRISAIWLGIFFQILLVLTLDVPAIFFFLFPAQFFLFIDPRDIARWIENKRQYHQGAGRPKLLYDGNCRFCVRSVEMIKVMDLFNTLELIDFRKCDNLRIFQRDLTEEAAARQLHLIEPDGRIFGGFFAFRRISFLLPMCYILIPIIYFPSMGVFGPIFYSIIAKNRYCFGGACPAVAPPKAGLD